jgi:serine/threonine protein kinase
LTHTNVVRIHDLGEIGGVKYITMPFLEGSDLATVLEREERLPVDRALRIARAALSGSAAASRPVMGDARPAAEVSWGKPGGSVLRHVWPSSCVQNTPSHASPVTLPSCTPGVPTRR